MDAALLSMMRSGGRNRAWAETMVNLEARNLVEAANVISGFHLRDSLTRLQFVQEIRDVVEKQFAAARQARTDEDCIACIKTCGKRLRTFVNRIACYGCRPQSLSLKWSLCGTITKLSGTSYLRYISFYPGLPCLAG